MLDFRLYLITDRKLFADNDVLFYAVEEALKAGVKAVQLREKDLAIRDLLNMAYTMRKLTKKYNAKLFINDRVDVAIAVDADGVHLGQQSMPTDAVRKIAKKDFLIGVSTHNADEALEAEKKEADFITFGPIYETPSKLKYGKPLGVDALKEVKSKISIPVFAIGGIKQDRIDEVIKAGADGVAIISAILASKDIKDETRKIREKLK
jgi:thiamine-phosphate pyrophosphorylase